MQLGPIIFDLPGQRLYLRNGNSTKFEKVLSDFNINIVIDADILASASVFVFADLEFMFSTKFDNGRMKFNEIRRSSTKFNDVRRSSTKFGEVR